MFPVEFGINFGFQDYVRQAEQFKGANCSLYGLGLQGHVYENTEPSPTLIKVSNSCTTKVNLDGRARGFRAVVFYVSFNVTKVKGRLRSSTMVFVVKLK